MDTLRGYVRDGQLFEDHTGEAFLCLRANELRGQLTRAEAES
jgi:hypothetical protein